MSLPAPPLVPSLPVTDTQDGENHSNNNTITTPATTSTTTTTSNNNVNASTNSSSLSCLWRDCHRRFPDHTALAHHLSEDHVGWKRPEYFCDWSDCNRRGVKCHSRFALMMHLRIHTGEKPFACNYPGCDQAFGRQDALVRHKKAEHEQPQPQPQQQQPSQQQQQQQQQPQQHQAAHPSTSLSRKSEGKQPSTKRRKLAEKQQASSNNAIITNSNSNTNNTTPVGGGGGGATTGYSSRERRGSVSEDEVDHSLSKTEKYKLAKAKLRYILRENELLNEEWASMQKKLKRLQTERKVLLEVLMGSSNHGNNTSSNNGNNNGSAAEDAGDVSDDDDGIDIDGQDGLDENDEVDSLP